MVLISLRRFFLALVNPWLGASVTNINSEVPVMDEFLDLILEYDTLLCGMADILVISVILALVSSGVVSSQWIRPLVDACLLGGQEVLLTRPS